MSSNEYLNKFEQQGGFPTLIPMIGQFIASVVLAVLKALKNLFFGLSN